MIMKKVKLNFTLNTIFYIFSSFFLLHLSALYCAPTNDEWKSVRIDISHRNFRIPWENTYTVTIPTYQYLFTSKQVQQSCVLLQCPINEENKSDNITWNGFYQQNGKINSALSPKELAKLLAYNIRGLDPLLADIILQSDAVKKSKALEDRPLNWEQFRRMIGLIENSLVQEKIIYNLTTQITAIFGLENAKALGYLTDKCQKTLTMCQAEKLDISKVLLKKSKKNIEVQFFPSSQISDTHLFEHELDSFEIFVGPNAEDYTLNSLNPYNEYQITTTPSPLNDKIKITINAQKRKIVPLPQDFIGVFITPYSRGMDINWKINDKYLRDMAINEQENIEIHYSICQKWLLGCRMIESENFRLSDKEKDFGPMNSLFYAVSLKDEQLISNKKYVLQYKINVRKSTRISSPLKNSFKLQETYIRNN